MTDQIFEIQAGATCLERGISGQYRIGKPHQCQGGINGANCAAFCGQLREVVACLAKLIGHAGLAIAHAFGNELLIRARGFILREKRFSKSFNTLVVVHASSGLGK